MRSAGRAARGYSDTRLRYSYVVGPAPEYREGDVLEGRYRLVARVGQGGFGDVWRAAELLPGGEVLREVALKLLHAGVAADQDWSAEARIIASLRHEALVTIYAAGVLKLDQEVPFVAMELLLGESLSERFKRDEQVAWRRVLGWAREAAAALDVIHLAGVVHLDLKPANLFFDQHQQLKVLDFGIAQQGRARTGSMAPEAAAPSDEMSTAAFMVAQDERTASAHSGTATVSRSVVGTPGFMAPEVFEGGEATHAADAYALASCIVQLVTGQLPQQLETRPPQDASTRMQAWVAEIQAATVRGRLRDLSAEPQPMPAALVSLLNRWLALDPLARGVKRGELYQQLDEVWQRPQRVSNNPYRGLSSYGADDEGALYGRSDEAARVARDLADQPCSVLHGPHGAGLRSLAAAGVVPALARAFADGRDDWLSLRLSASADGLSETLESWLDARGAGPPPSHEELAPPSSEPELADEVSAITDAAPLSRMASTQTPHHPQLLRLVAWLAQVRVGVTVLLSDLGEVTKAGRFVTELVELAIARPAGLRLIATLREEHVAVFVESVLGERLRPWLRYVSPPAASAAREIVMGPLTARGIEVAEMNEVARACQAELSADGARLPLVSLALHDWFERSEGALGAASWETLGGVVGALCRHADAVMQAFSSDQAATAARVLLRLVSADGTPLAVDRNLLLAGEKSAERDDVIARLQAEQLVVGDDGKVQLSHPELAEKWSWLVDARLHDLERLTFLEQFRAAVTRWQAAGLNPAELWSPARLAEFERHERSLKNELSEDELSFVRESRKRRHRGIALRLFAAACVLGVLFGAYWFDRTLDQRAAEHQRIMLQARRSAALDKMVAQSRRTEDPYVQVALLSAAMAGGSTDPVLPLELLRTSKDLVTAKFLTLDDVDQPQFPWDERWLIGISGRDVVVFDFKPPGGADFAPQVFRYRPHEQGIVDLVALPFDTSFVSRGLDGRLKVWRLRDDGDLALAAVSPMRCSVGLSQIKVAKRAPVIACPTADGIALWDLHNPDKVQQDAFAGRVLDIAPDGSRVVAARLAQVLFWQPKAQKRQTLELPAAPNLARFSPVDEVVALVRNGAVDVYGLAGDKARKLVTAETLSAEPVDARFSDDGLNFAVCEHDGSGEWHYLRKGARPEGTFVPAGDRGPCEQPSDSWPHRLKDARSYGEVISRKRLGPRAYAGGWMLSDRRFITRDLVMFDTAEQSLERLTSYLAKPAHYEPGDSASAMVRAGDGYAWQVGGFVRLHDASGNELKRQRGQLLGRCPDGQVIARRQDAAGNWELFSLLSLTTLRHFKRFDGFFLGLDPSCTRVFAQRLDGSLMSVLFDGDSQAPSEMKAIEVVGGSYVMDGYVYDARPSAAQADRLAGLWLAFSSGALLRVDASGAVTPFGNATPRATALADGPDANSLLFSDKTGVIVRKTSSRDRLVLAHQRRRSWEDIRVVDEGRYAWLGWAEGVALLDLKRAELLDQLKLGQRGRIAPWNDDGALLAWPASFMGNPRGSILPTGAKNAQSVAAAASNLRAALSADFDSRITLAD